MSDNIYVQILDDNLESNIDQDQINITSGNLELTYLNDLEDVNIINPLSGQSLIFDGNTWINNNVDLSVVNSGISFLNSGLTELNNEVDDLSAYTYINIYALVQEDNILNSGLTSLSSYTYNSIYTKDESDNIFVNTTGDTMTGNLVFSNAALDFDTGYTAPYREGRVFYDSNVKTLAYYNENSDVRINIGQEQVIRATNKTNNTILNGYVVVISGATGNHPEIQLASNNNISAHYTIGMATHNISYNESGYITVQGLVNDVNTEDFTEGDILWLATGGTITNIEPTAPIHKIRVGYCIYSHQNQGKILVSINFYGDLKDLDDVTITNPASGQTLVYSNGIWINSSTTVDLSNYYTKDEVYNSGQTDNLLSAKTDLSVYNNYTGVTDNNIQSVSSQTYINKDNISSLSGYSYDTLNIQNYFYTKAEQDSKFVYKTGDTMTGTLIVPSLSATTLSASTIYYTGNPFDKIQFQAITASTLSSFNVPAFCNIEQIIVKSASNISYNICNSLSSALSGTGCVVNNELILANVDSTLTLGDIFFSTTNSTTVYINPTPTGSTYYVYVRLNKNI